MITTYLYVLINAIRTPFQGGFLVRAAPRAEALGCSLSALRAIGAGPRKSPNSIVRTWTSAPQWEPAFLANSQDLYKFAALRSPNRRWFTGECSTVCSI